MSFKFSDRHETGGISETVLGWYMIIQLPERSTVRSRLKAAAPKASTAVSAAITVRRQLPLPNADLTIECYYPDPMTLTVDDVPN